MTTKATLRKFTAASVAGLLLAFAGCAKEGQPTIPVSGKVTFNHGSCPAEGTIAFLPVSVDAGLPRRPGTAEFGTDGAFQATSFRPGDGLLPGRYRAIVSCWKGEPTNDDPSSYEELNYVPRDYKPQEFVVAHAADAVEIAIDVPPKKWPGRRYGQNKLPQGRLRD